jgi:hypothetical protein
MDDRRCSPGSVVGALKSLQFENDSRFDSVELVMPDSRWITSSAS